MKEQNNIIVRVGDIFKIHGHSAVVKKLISLLDSFEDESRVRLDCFPTCCHKETRLKIELSTTELTETFEKIGTLEPKRTERQYSSSEEDIKRNLKALKRFMTNREESI